ncbi:MAG: hypothetical protein HFG60_14320 [Lachnospiraceae bacterium]|nr:hypothetical protein [Lachnospiraceae bacterium]
MRNRRLFRGNLFLLLITIILFSASRGKDKATTMKLIKTDGEVGVGDEKGKSVDLIDNLGLYNGYRIGTQTKSFALEEEESYTVGDSLGVYFSTENEYGDVSEAEPGLDNDNALYFSQGNGIYQPYSSYEGDGNIIKAAYQNIRGTFTDTFILNADGGLATEFGDDDLRHLNRAFAFKRERNEEELRQTAYQVILDEYVGAANAELNGNNGGFKQLYGKQYPNVDPLIMDSYLSPDNPWNLCYAYYDIDGNGADELLIGVGEGLDVTIIDLYTFDGRQAVKAVTHGSASFRIHTGGMIWEYTMSGEGIDTRAEYIFKKIADDGYSMEVEHIYTSHYDSQSGTNLSYRDNKPITWEKFQEVINHATNSDSFVKDFEWNDLMAKEPRIDRFLGTYTKNYGSYSYALILSVEEGALRYEVGNSYHGGWMASRYAEYSINGNELKATKEDGVHTFLLNEDGSITATFSDMDFDNGVYERNDEYDETEEYPEGYP